VFYLSNWLLQEYILPKTLLANLLEIKGLRLHSIHGNAFSPLDRFVGVYQHNYFDVKFDSLNKKLALDLR